ncbi:putative c2h2 finger domain-containing protein [Zalerion maritima]|uniref:C2h2 finger domain-containing protein n=1 Tax=Zalerion maritima TaxID=339359 RepID=A0AAD5S0I3_9PEZI|nr:putative c2h2 finger domain-containing protein [Zalerion maritima]
MTSPGWDGTFDFEGESTSGQYHYNYYDATYLAAPQPPYTVSGTTSPVSANSPQTATSEYTEDSTTFALPTTTWDLSGTIASTSFSTHSPPTIMAGGTPFIPIGTPSHNSPPAFRPAGSPGSVGSPTHASIDYVYSGSAPGSYLFVHRGSEFWSLYDYITTSDNGPYFRLQDSFQADEHFPRIIMHMDDPSALPPEGPPATTAPAATVATGALFASGAAAKELSGALQILRGMSNRCTTPCRLGSTATIEGAIGPATLQKRALSGGRTIIGTIFGTFTMKIFPREMAVPVGGVAAPRRRQEAALESTSTPVGGGALGA